MGEYATRSDGTEVKIGTCEDLLYLRFDQRFQVSKRETGQTSPNEDLSVWRFRFPFPDEDSVAPGEFSDPFRRVTVYGVSHPEGIEHHTLQFKNDHGYLVSLPCPEGVGDHGDMLIGEGRTVATYKVHRNGFKGGAFISQQRVWNGRLVTVAECACGAKYRLPTLEDATPWLVCLREMADQRELQEARDRNVHNDPNLHDPQVKSLRAIADRIEAGYLLSV